MTDEVKQAAERLRRIYPAGKENHKAVYGRDGAGGRFDEERDRGEVSNAFLPLLDPTPIDEAWCISIGATASFIDDWWQIDFDRSDRHLTILQKAIQISDWEDSVSLPMEIKTRGDVRQLCAALQITLTESEARDA